jgi:hypothetical protein
MPKFFVTSSQAIGDGVFFKIIAEREVTHHFEEGMVARGVADIIQIVVLAASANTFLSGGGAGVGAFFNAGENVFELDHAGVGEHQRGVVLRHERA